MQYKLSNAIALLCIQERGCYSPAFVSFALYHRNQQGLFPHGQALCHVDQYALRHQRLLANDLPAIIRPLFITSK